MERLILGAGAHHTRQPGETLNDRLHLPNIDVVHDLETMPWPWGDNSWTSVVAVHVVEHLKCLLVPFMNECWRILRPGGSLYLETPLAGADPDMNWADPTHVRCYRIHSFVNYLSPEGVDRFHYTDRAWNFFYLKHRESDHTLVVHAYPLKQ